MAETVRNIRTLASCGAPKMAKHEGKTYQLNFTVTPGANRAPSKC
jgi:hypothetical protein